MLVIIALFALVTSFHQGSLVTFAKDDMAAANNVARASTTARASNVDRATVVDNVNDAKSVSFEESLTREGFPESYKRLLRQVHAMYPNWRFVGDDTGLSWDQVVDKELNPVSINLVSHIRPDTWKSVEPGAYNTATNEYISYDSGGWVPADVKVVKYFLDPRNFLSTSGIFQFMSNKYNQETATAENVRGVTMGTFMDAKFPEKVDGKQLTYNQVIVKIGKLSGVNPMVIASVIIQEQGANGGGRCISGKEAGFKGIYNHWNIGAYKTSQGSAVTNGLRYAKAHGWNSRYKSILGGAKWFAERYVENNKHNSYLKKFNVMNGLGMVGSGQYMTNVEAAYLEGLGLRNGYIPLFSKALTFNIPIYRDLPSSPCKMPTGNGNHINFLRSLSVKGLTSSGQALSGNLKLSPSFESRTKVYKVTVTNSVSKVQFNYKTVDNGAKVSIKGANSKNQVYIPVGTKTINIKVTATSSRYRLYKVHVTRKGPSNDSVDKPPVEKPPVDKPTEPEKPTTVPKVTGITLDSDFGFVKVSYKEIKDSKDNKVSYRIAYREISSAAQGAAKGKPAPSSMAKSKPVQGSLAESKPAPNSMAESKPVQGSMAENKPAPSSLAESNVAPSSLAESNVAPSSMAFGAAKSQIHYVDTQDTSLLIGGLKINGQYGVRVAAILKDKNGKEIQGEYSKEYFVYANRAGNRSAKPYLSKIENIVLDNKVTQTGTNTSTKTATVTLKAIKYSKAPQEVTYRVRYKQDGTKTWKYISSSSNIVKIKGLTVGKSYVFEAGYQYITPLDNNTLVELPYVSKKVIKV